MVCEFSLLLTCIALVCSGAQAQSLDCNFDTNFCSWAHTGWRQLKGPTPSWGTGPDHDHTGGGSYIYLEASNLNITSATLYSPSVTIPSGGCLTFWYHMYGQNIGNLSVVVRPSSQLVWNKHGDQGNSWKQASVDLPPGVNIQVKIEATIGNGFHGDIGLDDITFTSNGCSNPNNDVTTNSSTQHLNGGVLISSTVDIVYIGLTASLTITCSVPGPSVRGYDNLVSVVISKLNNSTNKLEEIVSIDLFAPDVINTLQPTQAKANALFNNSGTSFMQLQWKYPQKSDTGFYQCEGTVLDNVGRPITLTSGLDIKHADPTITALMGTFRLFKVQMEDQFRNQTDELKNQDDQITVLRKQTDELKDKFTVFRNQMDDLKNRISMATGSMFDSTNSPNGWTYHFSKFAFGDVDKAEAACNLVNGHLVDFENKAEFDLVIGYIQSGIFTNPASNWLTGLSDEATEGTWLVRHSGQPARYIQWGSGEPDGARSEDCSTVYIGSGDMYDWPCTSTKDAPFICKSRQ